MAKGVKYEFSGQYYTGKKVEETKEYSIEVVFPGDTPKALSLFKTGLNQPHNAIYKLMVAKYPDFRRVRTHVITNVTSLDDKVVNANANVATMNTKQLTAYIKKNDLGIDTAVYEGDITRLRSAIIKAEEDPEAFKEQYAADVETYEFNKSLTDLNDVPEKAEEDSTTSTENVTADDLLADLGGDESGNE